MSTEEFKFKTMFARIFVKVWTEKGFFESLKKAPLPVLNAHGLHPPAGLNISIHMDNNITHHVVANPEWSKHGQQFIAKLNSSPKEALASIGYNIVDHVNYVILYNNNNLMNIVIPQKPSYDICFIEKIR